MTQVVFTGSSGTTLGTTSTWTNIAAGAMTTAATIQSNKLRPANWADESVTNGLTTDPNTSQAVIASGGTFAGGQTVHLWANASANGSTGYDCRITSTQTEVYRNGTWFSSQAVTLGALAADTTFKFNNSSGVLTLLKDGSAFASFTTDGSPLSGGYSGFGLYDGGTLDSIDALSWSDGITGSITDQPDSARITDGDKAYLKVGGLGLTDYQWQDNRGGSFANCPDGTGATTADYVTAALATAASGRQYRCLCNSGTLTSDAATITVDAKRSGTLGQFDTCMRIQGWF